MATSVINAVVNGAKKLYQEAVGKVESALSEYGESKKVEFPDTAYSLPLIYALTAKKINTLGELRKILDEIAGLIPREVSDIKQILDAGACALLAEEAIEAVRYLQPNPYTSPWIGFVPDRIIRELGIKLVDGRIPGIALIVGAPESPEISVKIIRELQERNILSLVVGSSSHGNMAEQLLDNGVELSLDTYIVPLGEEVSSCAHAANLAVRAAMTFGGISPDKDGPERIVKYCQERVPVFILVLGEDENERGNLLVDEKFATAAGALNLNFPVITPLDIPEVPGAIFPNVETDKIVPRALEIKGIKVKFKKMPIPVPYGSGFEGERVRKANMWVELGGRGKPSVELLIMKEMDEVEDGKIEITGPDIDQVEEKSSLPLAFVVEVAGKKMHKDFENVLERHIHHFLSCINGVMHTGQRTILWHRISKEAYEAGLRLKHLAKVVELKLKDEFSAIVDKVQVTIATDEQKVRELIKFAEPIFKERDDRILGMTDEEVDVFYSCVLCQSYAPNHVCIVSPERLGLCGAYTWIDCKASYEMNPKGANQPIEKGNVIDPERGEWEGINKFVYEKSNRAIERVHHYSIMSYPETSCCVADTNLFIDNQLTTFGEFFEEVWGTEKYLGKRCLTLDGNYKTSEDKIIALQKFKAPRELVRIETKTGLELIVTPDHKIPIDTPDGICWLKAEDLKIGDRLFSLKKINIPVKIPSILELLPDDFRIKSTGIIKEVREFLRSKYGSIKEGEFKLGVSFHYRKESISLRELRKLIGEGFPIEKLHTCEYEVGRRTRYYKLTSIKLRRELFYLLGLIASDGSLTKVGRSEYKITFVNTQPELVRAFISLTKRIFPRIKIWVSKNKKCITKIEGRKVKSKKVCYRVQLNDPLFGALAEGFGLGPRKEDHNFKLLFGLPEDYIASFIAGIFDGDGSVRLRKYKGKWEHPEIYIPVKEKKVAVKLSLLLRRIGIVPYIKKSKSLYKLYIYSENAYRFSYLVQSMHPLKVEKLMAIKVRLRGSDGLTKCQQNVLPYVVGKELVKIREGKDQLAATTCFYYSKFKSRPILANVLKIGEELLSPTVRKFISCDVMLDSIKEIKKISANGFDYVYNLTLSDIHSYFANGIWIANCGCFECIVGVIPEANGVMIVNREFQGETPLGMTFSNLAGSVGGGNQVPGFLGIGKLFITSKKFIKADGGIRRIVWMPRQLKEEIKERFAKRAEEEGVPDLLDKIGDEETAPTLEDLLSYLEKVDHPALSMPPILEM